MQSILFRSAPTRQSVEFTEYTAEELANNSATHLWSFLKVIEDGERGKGVAATVDIPKGRVICDYSGLIYRADEAEALLSTLSQSDQRFARSYAVEFEELYGGTFYVLAHYKEQIPSYGRLINHSAIHPNCRVYPKSITRPKLSRSDESETIRIIAVETTRKILKGEELVWDYGPKYAQEPWFHQCHCRKCASAYYSMERIPKKPTRRNRRPLPKMYFTRIPKRE